MNKKVLIIGAGPIGLYFATQCEERGFDYLILEGSNTIGGQLTRLYPEKEIVDIPGITSIKAKDFIKQLTSKINEDNIVFDEKVLDIQNGENIKVLTAKNTYFCEYLVIATGLGATTPRPLGVEHENEASNIIYSIRKFDHLANKKVAIFGGGDSALDWAKAISALSDDVHLIHRRLEFRGNLETIKDCTNLKLHLPYVPSSIDIKDGKAVSVTIAKADEPEITVNIPVDYIFVNYGNIALQYNFPFEKEGAFLKVNDNLEVESKIFAIGDVCAYQNKTRRIAPGMFEANKVIKLID